MTPGRRSAAWRPWASLAALALLATLSMHAIGDRDDVQVAKAITAALRPGDLRLVSSVDCRYCDAARNWLDRHGIAYSECLVEHDAACAETYRAAGAPGTPLVQVRDEWQVGFSPERVAQGLHAR